MGISPQNDLFLGRALAQTMGRSIRLISARLGRSMLSTISAAARKAIVKDVRRVRTTTTSHLRTVSWNLKCLGGLGVDVAI
jgi:hypothetical protein